MSEALLQLLLGDVLFILIAVGWVILIVAGIEPDKPLSGGIPGHVDLSHLEHNAPEGPVGQLGGRLGWVLFGAVSLSLPLILVWIFRVHGG